MVQVSDGHGGIDTQAIAVTIGLPVHTIESFGSTSLAQIGNNYFLGAGTAAPLLKYAGAAVMAGQFGAWAPIATEQTASGYEVGWKLAGADQYTAWKHRQ